MLELLSLACDIFICHFLTIIIMCREQLYLQGLRLGNDEIVRLRRTDMKNLLRQKKLYLVLDLDHTLLNSTRLMHITLEEEYLYSQIDSLQGMLI